MSNKATKRERQSETDVVYVSKSTAAAAPITNLLDNYKVKKEKVSLCSDDYNSMYFFPEDSDIFIKQKSCSDKYMPMKKQEKAVICAKAFNIKGELVFFQVWDNVNGCHAKYIEELFRLVLMTLSSTSLDDHSCHMIHYNN